MPPDVKQSVREKKKALREQDLRERDRAYFMELTMMLSFHSRVEVALPMAPEERAEIFRSVPVEAFLEMTSNLPTEQREEILRLKAEADSLPPK